jgi:hypothetical protein
MKRDRHVVPQKVCRHDLAVRHRIRWLRPWPGQKHQRRRVSLRDGRHAHNQIAGGHPPHASVAVRCTRLQTRSRRTGRRPDGAHPRPRPAVGRRRTPQAPGRAMRHAAPRANGPRSRMCRGRPQSGAAGARSPAPPQTPTALPPQSTRGPPPAAAQTAAPARANRAASPASGPARRRRRPFSRIFFLARTRTDRRAWRTRSTRSRPTSCS